MPTNLMQASRQWMTRPADERFWNLESMFADALSDKRRCEDYAVTKDDRPGALRMFTRDDDLLLAAHGDDGAKDFRLSNWAFRQLCARTHAPADYLSSLADSGLVADCLNKGLAKPPTEKSSGLQLYHDDGWLRAVTSSRYSRIHDADIIGKLMPLREAGWRTPPARPRSKDEPNTRIAKPEDCIPGVSLIQPGDTIGPAGLYRGDRDMFAFLINPDVRINDGTDGGLAKGFFVGNSEVGKTSFFYMEFGFRVICGNHIVWGADNIREVRLRHVGADMPGMVHEQLVCQLREYAASSVAGDELLIKRAQNLILGENTDQVVDWLFGKRLMSRALAAKSYNLCETWEPKLNPRSAWGVINGLTRASQDEQHADRRAELDAITPKILAFAK